MRPLALAPLLLLCACHALRPAGPVAPNLTWRNEATNDDVARLREWRTAFAQALIAARHRHSAEIAREGGLLEPDAALSGGPIPNGDYRCRVIKLGAKSQGLLDYVAYPAFRCRIAPAGGLQSFAKLTGSQRYIGRIFPSDNIRQVFLGTLVLGDEQQAMRYGADRDRDVAGYVEQIGPQRWRLVMPRPHFESQLDVLELIPSQ